MISAWFQERVNRDVVVVLDGSHEIRGRVLCPTASFVTIRVHVWPKGATEDQTIPYSAMTRFRERTSDD